MLGKLWRALEERPLRCLLVLYAVMTITLVRTGLFDAARLHWHGWADQGAYLRSAVAFAHLSLDSAAHWYPLLYSLAGAPFVFLPTPFLPIDVACYLVAFVGFRRVARAFDVGTRAALLLFAATTLLSPWIGNLWIEPWTTTLSTALLWLALGVAADALVLPDTLTVRRAALFGLVLALIPLARPADIILSALIVPFALWRPIVRERRFALLPGFVAAGVAAVGAYALLHLAIYGWRASDYMMMSRDYGFDVGLLGFKTIVLLIDPLPWFPRSSAALKIMPWLIVGAAGLIAAPLIARDAARRALALCLLLLVLAYGALMFSYVDLLPSGFWRYNNVHYFKWTLPLFGLFAWYLVRAWRRHWPVLAPILLLLLVLGGLRVDARPAADGEPARALVFHGPPGPWADVYMAPSAILDGPRLKRNFFEYHQIPSDNGVVAVALRDPFGPKAIWIPKPHDELVDWPTPPGENHLAALQPTLPIARWAPVLRIGYPCWLPPYPCGGAVPPEL